MSLRDLFQEIKTERCQEVFLPKTNSVVVKNIPEGNLDLQSAFPDAVDFVLQAKRHGVTAVVSFKTPEEAAQAAEVKVNICGKEIIPKLLVEAKGKKIKTLKVAKGVKKTEKGVKKTPIVFERIEAGGDFGKKVHLWKLTKNIKMQVKSNWNAIKAEAKVILEGERKDLLGEEITFLRSCLLFLENHKRNALYENSKNFPDLTDVQKDELLWGLRQELDSCVQRQIDVIQSAKMPEGSVKAEAKFSKEIRFLQEFQKILKTACRKKIKKGKKGKK